MLTEKHCRILTTDTLMYDWEGFKKQFPTYSFMHGMVLNPETAKNIWGKTLDTIICADIEINKYHALIIDNEIRAKIAAGTLGGAPLKDMLTGKDMRAVVERFQSSDPAEIQAFIQKWLNPKFKFDVQEENTVTQEGEKNPEETGESLVN